MEQCWKTFPKLRNTRYDEITQQRTKEPVDERIGTAPRHEVRDEMRIHFNDRWKINLEQLDLQQNSFWKLHKTRKFQPTTTFPNHTEKGIVRTEKYNGQAFADDL